MIGTGLRCGLINEAVADLLEIRVVQKGDGMRDDATEMTRDCFVKTEKEIDLLNIIVQKIKSNVTWSSYSQYVSFFVHSSKHNIP